MCVCQWEGDKVVSMCGAHYDAARREFGHHAEKEKQLVESLRAIMTLVEQNELVRNPAFDHMADWWKRMVVFVGVLKKAQELIS